MLKDAWNHMTDKLFARDMTETEIRDSLKPSITRSFNQSLVLNRPIFPNSEHTKESWHVKTFQKAALLNQVKQLRTSINHSIRRIYWNVCSSWNDRLHKSKIIQDTTSNKKCMLAIAWDYCPGNKLSVIAETTAVNRRRNQQWIIQKAMIPVKFALLLRSRSYFSLK